MSCTKQYAEVHNIIFNAHKNKNWTEYNGEPWNCQKTIIDLDLTNRKLFNLGFRYNSDMKVFIRFSFGFPPSLLSGRILN